MRRAAWRIGLVAAAALSLTGSAAAQEPPATAPPMALGGDAVVLLPMGDFAKVTGAGIGAMARFEYGLDPTWSLTARAGFIYHTSKESAFRTTELPVLAGAKMFFEPVATGWYAAAEAGAVQITFHSKASGILNLPGQPAGQDLSASEWELGATLGAGYTTGPIDARAGVFFASLDEMSKSASLMAGLGYTFTTF